MKSASIFFRKNDIIIHALSKTQAGFWVSSEPYIKLERTNNHNELIASILKALDGSKTGVSTPTDWTEATRFFLDKLGLKSTKDLEKPGTKYCSIQMADNVIAFTPSKHATPPDKGFLHKSRDEAEKIVYPSSDEEIAQALEKALSKCE